MQSSLSVGDEVVLTSGVYGVVDGVEDDHLLLRVAEGVVIKVARGAVGSIATRAEQPEDPADPANEDTSGTTAGPEEN